MKSGFIDVFWPKGGELSWPHKEEASSQAKPNQLVLTSKGFTAMAKPMIATNDWVSIDAYTVLTDVSPHAGSFAEQSDLLEQQVRFAFGYAQRVGDLCKRLEAIETTFTDIVGKLDRATIAFSKSWVPVSSFVPEPFEVLKPLTFVLTPTEDGFEAGFFDAGMFASGDTESEAVSNLKSVIAENFDNYLRLGDEKLGPAILRQKRILSEFLRKIG